jgi:sialate O-acetylesterase
MDRALQPNALRALSLAGALIALVSLPASAAHAQQAKRPLLHALFRDHSVLQRGQPIPVWGNAAPGDEVRVSLAASSTKVRADYDGHWEVRLPAMKAGGPYALRVVSNDASQSIDDVMVGDVWLCSGQSNMELQVHRTLDSRSEIDGAHNDRIRLLTVPQAGSPVPLADFTGPMQWQPTTPTSVREFSAACYYFARELQKSIDVPIGLVNASWGGSAIQAWISGEGLRATGFYNAGLDVLASYATHPFDAAARWGELWGQWWSALPQIAADDTPWRLDYSAGAGWNDVPRELRAWEHWGVPALADFNGMLWYRAKVTLSERQASQKAVLALGAADEIDMTWVNGRGVGSAYGGEAREYPLPDGLLKAGDNVVAVNVLDTYRDGGLTGPTPALHFADGTSVPLRAWKYRVVPKETESPPRAPWQTAAGLSTLYNGMIAPLGHYGLRGIAWYQGESNTFEAKRYRDLLRVLRSDWRSRFGKEVPLLVVQLAAYGDPPTQPGESQWAELRDVQREVATEEPRSGLAVTIDIGDRYDLHPPNKQELGRRLARAARHAAYGEAQLPPSGPVPLSAKQEGDAVVVTFGDVTGDLVAYGSNGPVGFALCGAEADSCRYADARIRGKDVLLRATVVNATRVRYGWADSPVVTLFDGARLPAGPFEIQIK